MKILFVNEGNMMRSQMAEAFFNELTQSHDAMSAGALAATKDHISPRATEVMKELGYETGHLKPLQLVPEMVDEADRVIYFPSEYMPDYVKNSPKSELWEVADPHYNKEKGMPFVRAVRDEIKKRGEELVVRIGDNV